MKAVSYTPFLCIVLACLTHSTVAQSYSNYIKQADSLFNIRDYEGSLKFYAQAFEIKSTVPNDLYNCARSAARSDASMFAIGLLKNAIENGFKDINRLTADENLKSLHALPQWAELIDDLERKVSGVEPNYDKVLQQELLQIFDADQSVRQAYMSINLNAPGQKPIADSLRTVMHRTDSINLVKVTKIVDERGWVGRDVVSIQASDAIFLVIQHADLATQIKYLPLLKDAVKRKVAAGKNLALLEDRVAIRQGRKQIYGSQIGRNEKTGLYFIMPLEDAKNVDVRRASVGLEPMSDYAKAWGIQWDPNTMKNAK